MGLSMVDRDRGGARGAGTQMGAGYRRLRDYPMPPADEPLIPHLIDLMG